MPFMLFFYKKIIGPVFHLCLAFFRIIQYGASLYIKTTSTEIQTFELCRLGNKVLN